MNHALNNEHSRLNQLRAKPLNLIENRIGFAGNESELCIYDTYTNCKKVGLDSDGITLCGMITGKKIVHIKSGQFDFLPGQSFVMSPNQRIEIDFPDAQIKSPTTCLTIHLSTNRIKQVCDQLNVNKKSFTQSNEWHYRHNDHLHMELSQPTQALLQRLVDLYSENSSERDVMIELGVSELIIRMLQQQTRNFLLAQINTDPECTGLHKALHHLETHLDEPINMDHLQKLACMSRSKFYQYFKHHIGCTPAEFQIQRRMENAATKLKHGMSVTQACVESGFKNVSHFSRRFYQYYGKSPSEFKNAMFNNLQSN